MDVNAKYNAAPAAPKVVFESVWAEKAGGGLVVHNGVAVPAGTPVGQGIDGVFGTSVKLCDVYSMPAIGSGSAFDVAKSVEHANELANGKKIELDGEFFVIEGFTILNNAYEFHLGDLIPETAKSYTLKFYDEKQGTPVFTHITGADIPANAGDTPVRLINGANVRAANAPQALKDNIAQLDDIFLV